MKPDNTILLADPVQVFLPTSPGVVSIIGSGGKTSLMFSLARLLRDQGQRVLTTTTTKIYHPTPYQSSLVLSTSEPIRWISCHQKHIDVHRHITLVQNPLPHGKMQGFEPQIIDILSSLRCFDWILVEADGAAHRPLKAPADHEPVIPRSSSAVITVVGIWGLGKPLTSTWVFRTKRFALLAQADMQQLITPDHVSRTLLHPNGSLRCSPQDSRNVLFVNMAGPEGYGSPKQEAGMEKLIVQTKSRFDRRIAGWTDPHSLLLKVKTVADRSD